MNRQQCVPRVQAARRRRGSDRGRDPQVVRRGGDTVTDSQVVCEVETAKAAVELPSPSPAWSSELRVEEGTTVDVGTPIITVGTPARRRWCPPRSPPTAAPAARGARRRPRAAASRCWWATAWRESVHQAPPAQARRDAPCPAQPRRRRRAAGRRRSGAGRRPAAARRPGAPAGARPLAKPPVRKLAKDLGVDLARSCRRGAGRRGHPRGRAAAAQPPAGAAGTGVVAAPASAAGAPVAAAEPGARERRVPVKGVRKATAAGDGRQRVHRAARHRVRRRSTSRAR